MACTICPQPLREWGGSGCGLFLFPGPGNNLSLGGSSFSSLLQLRKTSTSQLPHRALEEREGPPSEVGDSGPQAPGPAAYPLGCFFWPPHRGQEAPLLSAATGTRKPNFAFSSNLSEAPKNKLPETPPADLGILVFSWLLGFICFFKID